MLLILRRGTFTIAVAASATISAAIAAFTTPAPPALDGPPIPSESSWSSSTDQCTECKCSRQYYSTWCYLHSSFIVQSDSHEGDVWIADGGASCHVTHDGTGLYDLRPPPPGRETITIGDRRKLRVECVGNMHVIFHRYTDERITMIGVSYVPCLEFKLYSLHAVQRAHLIAWNSSGTHIIGTNLTFPRSSSGS